VAKSLVLARAVSAFFYSRLLPYLHRAVFIQQRPTFDREGEPRFGDSGQSLYQFLVRDRGVNDRCDLVRYYFLFLQLQRIEDAEIPGDIAELGVYKGDTAEFLRRGSTRRLHLFDTFEGFDPRDSSEFAASIAFKDVEYGKVAARVQGDRTLIYKGYFPETAADLPPDTKFCLVHIDMDLYEPIRAALTFFYPRVSPGGVLIVHDYNNLGSWEGGARRAVDEFLVGKPEPGVEMPDRYGSIVIMKVKT
jgi:O-methyltransferase